MARSTFELKPVSPFRLDLTVWTLRRRPHNIVDRWDGTTYRRVLELRNRPPGAAAVFPAKEIVDAGFLELVRYGIRQPGDPLIEDSLRVIDAFLKVDAPCGPCWRRYNHDPHAHMYLGRPTGGAMPLAWAHAEYIKLVRSAADGQVFDLISEVADRYRNQRKAPSMEIWKFNRQVRSVRRGGILRIQAASSFRLHWTCDEWKESHDTNSASVGALGRAGFPGGHRRRTKRSNQFNPTVAVAQQPRSSRRGATARISCSAGA